MKVFYFDTETTGTNPVENGIWQIAGLIEVDGEVVDEFDIKMTPFPDDKVDLKALDVGGVTIEQLSEFQTPNDGYIELTKKLGNHVDKWDKTDKFYPAGYNVGFDIQFLAEFFKKVGDPYLGSWINWRAIDALAIVRFLEFLGEQPLPDQKLGTVCKEYGIDLDNAHDALADIKATGELTQLLKRRALEAPRFGLKL